MIKLKDYTNGKKPKYYITSELGNYAYASKEMLDAWIEFHINIVYKRGQIKDIEYELVNFEVEEGNLKQNLSEIKESIVYRK
jgi:hypothetical protein